jgi:hypothetical protein
MIDLLSVLNGVAALSIALGAVFAVLQLRGIQRDRSTQLVITLFSQFLSELSEAQSVLFSEEFKDVADMRKKCSEEGLVKLAGFYEGVGFLVSRGLVDARVVVEFLPVRPTWERMKPWVLQYREKGPAWWTNFEFLANLDQRTDQGLVEAEKKIMERATKAFRRRT